MNQSRLSGTIPELLPYLRSPDEQLRIAALRRCCQIDPRGCGSYVDLILQKPGDRDLTKTIQELLAALPNSSLEYKQNLT